jgi:16S rRNA (cytidine1402-2'-O)-methyltransferase
MQNKLYILGTPIGNLEDITLRALRILKEADLILSEDTRVTKKLLDKYEINTPLQRFDAKFEIKNTEKVISLLKEGKNMVLVTDAGTPGVSDPGGFIVRKVRETLGSSFISPIPGASSLTTAISVAGLSKPDFVFLGFLPHKKGRETLFKEISQAERAYIFLESLSKNLPQNREILLARELTKIYEEVISGGASEVLEHLLKNPEKIRGEFVVIVSSK